MSEKTVFIPAISCGHCVMTIKREVSDLPGVELVEGDPETQKATIKWSDPATWESISATLAEIGYPAKE